MKKYFACFILNTLFSFLVLAQIKEPKKIDEFGVTNSEILEARLDYYQVELYNNRDSFLQILIHRGEKQSPGSPYRLAAVLKTYLTSKGKTLHDKIIITNCQVEEERHVQIWLLPDKASQKNCDGEQRKLETTTLFDSIYYSNPDFGSCCAVDEYDDEEMAASLVAFAEELKNSPESKAYLFLYHGTNIFGRGYANEREKPVRKSDSPNLLRAMSKNASRILAENGIDSSRVILINGGFKDTTRSIELWFVPKGGEIPKPKPDYFPKKKKSKNRSKN